MGWFFDNFWAVLSGKQDTFVEKANLKGQFTHTRCPEPDKLAAELQRELNRPEIQSLNQAIVKPSVFAAVAEWRQKAGL